MAAIAEDRKATAIYQIVNFLSLLILSLPSTLNVKPNNRGNGPQMDWLKGEPKIQNGLADRKNSPTGSLHFEVDLCYLCKF
jgi:hypothetical protein